MKSSAEREPHGEFMRQLDHLTILAADPGWKAYAWARAKELDADASGLWAGIARALELRMKARSMDAGRQ